MHNWRDKCYSGTGGVVSPTVALGWVGMVGDGTRVGSISIGAVVRKQLGWRRGVGRQLEGSWEGRGRYGGSWGRGWLVGR